MEFAITYKTALKLYPNHVKEVLDIIRSSKSIQRNSYPQDFKWFYKSCLVVKNGGSFQDILNNRVLTFSSAEEELQYTLKNVKVHLQASKKRCYSNSSELNNLPFEVVDWYRKNLEAKHLEKKRFDCLSEIEKQEELNNILKNLSKNSGFFK